MEGIGGQWVVGMREAGEYKWSISREGVAFAGSLFFSRPGGLLRRRRRSGLRPWVAGGRDFSWRGLDARGPGFP